MEAIRRAAGHFNLSVKILLDYIITISGLIILSPLMLIIAATIYIIDGRPIFYTQKRVGMNGKTFNLIKFRTMVVGAHEMLKDMKDVNRSAPVAEIKNDPRVIPIVGKFMRKHCLDEFPQIINILMGDMTVVGPRPALPEEVAKYERWHYERLAAKPGLTCYWQISKRGMPFDDWVKSDIRYIENNNIWIDIKIILITFWVLFRGH